MNIGFLGVGNMGSAILKGYKNKNTNKDEFFILGRNREKLEKISVETESKIASNIGELVERSDVLFIGVKPKDFGEILEEISKHKKRDIIYVSMAAGISIAFIESILGDVKIVRIMPNTPAKIGLGVTSISANQNVGEEDLSKVRDIMSSIGVCIDVEEAYIHDVIGMSGSSPAYTYMYIKSLVDEAVSSGIDEAVAKKFVANAVIGAASMILAEDEDIQTLIDNVCSPNGTTIEAVKTFERENFTEIVKKGYRSAKNRSKEMEK